MEPQKPRIAKTILNSERTTGLSSVSSCIIVIKTASYWHKNRHIDQQNRSDDPGISLSAYESLIFDKEHVYV